MRRILVALAFVLAAVLPARAQNCVTINGISRCAMPWQIYDTVQRQVSTPVLDLTQTWNQSSVTFTGFKLNVTDTGSASGSLLLDLQVGGTSKFSVNKSGNIVAAGTFTPTGVGLFPDGTAAVPSIAFASEPGVGLYRSGAGVLAMANTNVSGGVPYSFGSSGQQLGSAMLLSWSSTTSALGSADTTFTRTAAGTVGVTGANITVGSGTGVTVNNTGALEWQVYKVTVASTNFIANAVTADVTLATLPAKAVLGWVIADLTTTFACASTCTTATLSMTCGKTAGGAEYVVSFDADAATGQFGDAQAEVGAALKTATPPVTPIGDLASWTATTAVQCRLTSGTGNIGTGAATNLSQGSVTFYLATTRLP